MCIHVDVMFSKFVKRITVLNFGEDEVSNNSVSLLAPPLSLQFPCIVMSYMYESVIGTIRF